MDQQTSAAAIAEAFVAARREARGLPDYPGTMPATLDEAYSIQDAAIRANGKAIAGWKVGRINAPLDAQHGANRLAGPIFGGTIFTATDGSLDMPIFTEGFGAAEAEFLLRVGTAPDPARAEWTLADAAAHIDAVHVGIEIAGHQAFSANLYTVPSDLCPRKAVGSVIGIGVTVGAIGGKIFAKYAGYVLDAFGSYAPLFAVAGGAYFIALAFIHFLSPRLARVDVPVAAS